MRMPEFLSDPLNRRGMSERNIAILFAVTTGECASALRPSQPRFAWLRLLCGDATRPRIGNQCVIGYRYDRGEVAMGDPVRPGRRADVVRDRAKCKIDDLARVGRDV